MVTPPSHAPRVPGILGRWKNVKCDWTVSSQVNGRVGAEEP